MWNDKNYGNQLCAKTYTFNISNTMEHPDYLFLTFLCANNVPCSQYELSGLLVLATIISDQESKINQCTFPQALLTYLQQHLVSHPTSLCESVEVFTGHRIHVEIRVQCVEISSLLQPLGSFQLKLFKVGSRSHLTVLKPLLFLLPGFWILFCLDL